MSLLPPYGQMYHVPSVTQIGGETEELQFVQWDHQLQTLPVAPTSEPTTLRPGNTQKKD